MARADVSLAAGTVLGSYRLLQQIGEGGMGRVFTAEHIRLGRKVALKTLRPEFSGNPEAVRRFFAEARAVNCISHENIIEVSDFVENPYGTSYCIMELLSGMDLAELESREGVLELGRGLRIAIQVCGALEAAHRVGIIHRDLKPDNIYLIERSGRGDFVKLLDFGVAKLMNDTLDDAAAFRSSAGMVVGTPDYMAPEQALGHAVNHLADVYSLGVILFEMFAGRRPFVGKSARDVMVQHLTALPARPSQLNPASAIPEALEELILACLSKDPADRPQTAQDVEQRLRGVLDSLPSAGAGRRSRSPARRRVAWTIAGVALAGAVAASLATGGPPAWARYAASHVRAQPATTRPQARSTFTIEAMAPTAPAPPPRVETLRHETTPVEAAPAAARMPVSAPAAIRPPAPARRRPTKLDHNAVFNPFE